MLYAIRTLIKTPGFTIIAILTLALGIGANTAIFGVVNSVLLKPLRAQDPGRLVSIWERMPSGGQGSIAYLNLRDLRAQNHTLDKLEGFFPRSFNLKTSDRPERVRGVLVTAGWLDVFGVRPLLGRTFRPDEDQPGSEQAVVLAEDLWRRDFASDASLVGKTISLDSEKFTVVGIMPSAFRFPYLGAELWVPLNPTPVQLDRGANFLRGTARLKPGVRIEQVRADLSVIKRRIAQQFPREAGSRADFIVISLVDAMVGDSRTTLWIMLGAVAFVFLISCANVSNLLLVRASARQKEISIRRALGATQGLLLRQFGIEGLLLAAGGAALGWLLALWGIDLLVSLQPANLPRANEIAPDWRVLGFTIGVSLLAAVSFAFASVLQSSAFDVNSTLKEGGRGSAGGSQNRLRSLLVIGEVATALVLLAGAGLLIESFWRLQSVNPGFRASHVLTTRLDLPSVRYSSGNSFAGFWDPLVTKVAALPGVQSVGAIDYLPVEEWGVNGDFHIEKRPDFPPGQEPSVEQRVIGADYFQTLSIPLVAGRFFSDVDVKGAPPVVVINQTMARRFWGNQSPIGSRMRFWSPEWMTIVGVAGDIRQSGIDTAPASELYVSWKQLPVPLPLLSMSLVIRTSTDPASLASAVRTQVQAVDPDQPVSRINTMDQVLADYLADRRFTMFVLATFATVAMLLAALGIYGVMAFAVRQRTREIGIRLALGASIANVFQVVFAQGMRLVGVGVAIGIAGAWAVTRVLSSLLYEVSATNALTYAAVSAVLAAVALLAIYIPARRATRVDPMIALRYE